MADKYPIILNKLHDGVSVLQYCDRKDKGSLEDYFAGFFNYNGNIKIDRNRKIFIGNN